MIFTKKNFSPFFFHYQIFLTNKALMYSINIKSTHHQDMYGEDQNQSSYHWDHQIRGKV